MARRDGFTLAELLVASMLLSIVMTAVYTLFYTTINSWKAVDIDYDMPRAARNLLSAMERDYDNVLYEASHLVEGDGDRVKLFTVMNALDPDKGDGRHLLQVRYIYNRSRKTVIREESKVDAALPLIPAFNEEIDLTRLLLTDELRTVVGENIKSFNIRYVWMPLLASEDDEPPEWTKPVFARRHKEKWGMPQGIEVSLTFFDPAGKKPDFSTKLILPTRTINLRLNADDLGKRLEGAL